MRVLPLEPYSKDRKVDERAPMTSGCRSRCESCPYYQRADFFGLPEFNQNTPKYIFACAFVIYQITNLINNKCYIGQTINYKSRWASHKTHANLALDGYVVGERRVQVIHVAMAKYGIDNFDIKILAKTKRF